MVRLARVALAFMSPAPGRLPIILTLAGRLVAKVLVVKRIQRLRIDGKRCVSLQAPWYRGAAPDRIASLVL